MSTCSAPVPPCGLPGAATRTDWNACWGWRRRGRGCTPGRRRTYLQEYIDGEPCATVYVGDGRRAALLGITRQLIGEPCLHAPPFHYGGSVGPLIMSTATERVFARLGEVLTAEFGLRGL